MAITTANKKGALETGGRAAGTFGMTNALCEKAGEEISPHLARFATQRRAIWQLHKSPTAIQ